MNEKIRKILPLLVMVFAMIAGMLPAIEAPKQAQAANYGLQYMGSMQPMTWYNKWIKITSLIRSNGVGAYSWGGRSVAKPYNHKTSGGAAGGQGGTDCSGWVELAIWYACGGSICEKNYASDLKAGTDYPASAYKGYYGNSSWPSGLSAIGNCGTSGFYSWGSSKGLLIYNMQKINNGAVPSDFVSKTNYGDIIIFHAKSPNTVDHMGVINYTNAEPNKRMIEHNSPGSATGGINQEYAATVFSNVSGGKGGLKKCDSFSVIRMNGDEPVKNDPKTAEDNISKKFIVKLVVNANITKKDDSGRGLAGAKFKVYIKMPGYQNGQWTAVGGVLTSSSSGVVSMPSQEIVIHEETVSSAGWKWTYFTDYGDYTYAQLSAQSKYSHVWKNWEEGFKDRKAKLDKEMANRMAAWRGKSCEVKIEEIEAPYGYASQGSASASVTISSPTEHYTTTNLASEVISTKYGSSGAKATTMKFTGGPTATITNKYIFKETDAYATRDFERQINLELTKIDGLTKERLDGGTFDIAISNIDGYNPQNPSGGANTYKTVKTGVRAVNGVIAWNGTFRSGTIRYDSPKVKYIEDSAWNSMSQTDKNKYQSDINNKKLFVGYTAAKNYAQSLADNMAANGEDAFQSATRRVRVTETSAPTGYRIVANGTMDASGNVFFDATNKTTVTGTIENTGYDITINKVNATGGAVSGAKLKLTRKSDGKVLADTWNGATKTVKGIKAGEVVVVTEEAPAEGYVIPKKTVYEHTMTTGTNSVTIPNYQVKVLKKDTTGNVISGAKLQVTKKGDTNVIDSWTTDGKHHVVKGLKEGENYTLTETSAPAGYGIASPMDFTPAPGGDLELIMIDPQVRLLKTDKDGNFVTGAVIEIRDDTGAVVDTITTEGKVAIVKGTAIGKTYTAVETKVPAGYILAKPVTKTIQEGVDTNFDMVDGRLYIQKTDTAGKAVSGAEITVYDADNKEVDKWTTDGNPHPVSNLEKGKTYRAEETKVAKGYIKAPDLTFTVPDADTTTNLVMKDAKITALKTDGDGNPLAGAKMEVVDVATGTAVDSWTSTTEAHLIANLEMGKRYRLVETEAPKSYVIGDPQEFIADSNTTDKALVMIDPRVKIRKVDKNDKYVAGNELAVYDKDGNEIEKWTSTDDAHFVSGLTKGEPYTLKELKAAPGYVIADPVTFTVTQTSTDTVVKMVDTQVAVLKVDKDDNPISGAELAVYKKGDTTTAIDTWTTDGNPHNVNNLVQGTTYIVREIKAPRGYVIADDIEFTTNKPNDIITVKMIDPRVIVKKVDPEGAYLAGAELTVVTDDADQTEVDKWVTDGGPHNVENLVKGNKYILKETKTPEGYVEAKPIKFTANSGSADIEVTMVDKIINLSKVDENGNKIGGAHFEVRDKDGNVVDEWVSEAGKMHIIKNLVKGQRYTGVEVQAPTGYATGANVTINTDDEDNTNYKILDCTQTIYKKGPDGEQVKGAKLQLQDKKKNVIDEWVTGQQIVALTEAESKDLEAGKTVKGNKQVCGNNAETTITPKKGAAGLFIVEAKTGAEYAYYEINSDGSEAGHMVQNTKPDTDYKVVEVETPKGYVKAQDMATKTNLKKNTQYTMIDQKVTFSKVDAGGEEVKGAHIQVLDKKGKVVDEWDSVEGKVHAIENLEVGQTYTIRETIAPGGYLFAQDFPFTITPEEAKVHYEMVDTIQTVYKKDADGNFVYGAKLGLRDKKTGKFVDEWVSGQSIINLTKEQTYQLENGEELEITRQIAKNQTVEEGALETPADPADPADPAADPADPAADPADPVEPEPAPVETREVIYKIIPKKNDAAEKTEETPVKADEEVPGDTTEPEADVDAEGEDKNLLDTIKDIISKPKYETFLLQTLDVETNAYSYYEIDSKGREIGHRISNAMSEKDYDIVEIETPEGYVKAADTPFRSDGKNDSVYTIIDQRVSFTKEDINGEEVPGAKIEVIDKETNKVVDSWISTEELHYIKNLEVGKKYILKETITPGGYVQATALDFELTPEGINSHYKMVDTIHRVAKMSDDKVDANGRVVEKAGVVKGARLAILAKDGKTVIDEWTTGQKIIDVKPEMIEIADKEGKYTFKEAEQVVSYGEAEITAGKENLDAALAKEFPDLDFVPGQEEDKPLDEEGTEETPAPTPEEGTEENPVVAKADEDTPLDPDAGEELDPVEGEDPTEPAEEEKILTTEDYVQRIFETMPYSSEELQTLVDEFMAEIDKMKGMTDKNDMEDVRQKLYARIEEEVKKMDELETQKLKDISSIYIIPNKGSAGGYSLIRVNGDGTMSYTDIDEYGDEANHRVSGMMAGEEYILRELKAPADFQLAPDMSFIASPSDDIVLKMVDQHKLLAKKTGTSTLNYILIAGGAAALLLVGCGFVAIRKRFN